MKIQPFTLGEVSTNTYLVYGLNGNDAILVDAPDGIGKVIRFIRENGLDLKYILLTHAHFDHVMGLTELSKEFPDAEIFVDQADSCFLLNSGEMNVKLLSESFPFMLKAFRPYLDSLPTDYRFYGKSILSFSVIRTPGHTEGSVCLYDEKEKILFSGDTIFSGSYGRTDFPGGNQGKLFRSIRTLLSSISDDTLILPGHGAYTEAKKEKAFYGLL